MHGMERSGLSRCVHPEEGQGATRLWGASSRDGFNSGAGVLEEVLNDPRARIRAGRPSRKRGSYATQTKSGTKDSKHRGWRSGHSKKNMGGGDATAAGEKINGPTPNDGTGHSFLWLGKKRREGGGSKDSS